MHDKERRLPPGQIETAKFPVMLTGSVPNMTLSDWRLHIFGLVESETTLQWEDILALPKVRATSDIHCVTTWSRLDNDWEGVALSDVVHLARPSESAKYVIVHGEEGYSVSMKRDDLLHEGVMLAYRHDGEDLTPEHGFPLRLVIPHLYFWKSVKWVSGIEFADQHQPGFWEQRGYHPGADVWKEERYALKGQADI